MLHLRSSRSALLPLGALAIAAALSACGQNNQPSAMGSANVSVQALSAVPLGQVTVTISGPALYAPKPVILSPQGSGGSYGALISSLPVGSNYTFTVSASDTSNTLAYVGQATNVAILHNHVTTVVITAQPATPPAPFANTVPIIDSLVVSSTNIAPGETITAKVQAEDLDPGDSITFAWSGSPAGGSFSAATAATTTWTAPATEGDVTLTISVKDTHGAVTAASIVIHVSNANGTGQADVNVKFNNWPAVMDVLATPGWITLGAPTALSVTASDADGDALTYLWSTGTTCTAGSFSSATSSTPSFTLPASATDTYCEFDVAVSDGHGGTTHGTLYLPVGAPVSIIAPAIVDAAQSALVVDPSAAVSFSVEAMDPQAGTMTFVWSTTGGTLSGQSDTGTTSQVTLTAPATASSDVVVSVVVTDAVGASKKYDFSVHTAAVTTACTPPASTAWKFGMMSDTQWTTADPAGQNPTTVSVSIINQLNPVFIAAGVKFVIQVGDLADTGNDADEIVRAQAAQPLLDAGIGFFPMRGNHETYGTANSFAIPVFQTSYPQTRGLSNTFGATNFSSPTSLSTELDGMTYSFDYNNARFVILDTWATPSIDISAAGYTYGYSVAQQQPWINSRLDKTTRGTDHAFVMSHQPLMAESHQDTMFQGYTNANPDMQNAFYASLQSNNVKYFLAGHDHMNQNSIIASPDGLSSVHEIIGASDSSKFYTPSAVSGANWFGQKVRETPDGPGAVHGRLLHFHGGWGERDGGFLLRHPRQLEVRRQLPARNRPS
jgi:hypothetical protein